MIVKLRTIKSTIKIVINKIFDEGDLILVALDYPFKIE